MTAPQRPERVVILCGGRGYRMGEETDLRPKPMVPIGGRPILWHIMKIYSHFGFRRFVLCLGYKGDMIRDYFLLYHHYSQDFIIRTGACTNVEHIAPADEEWEIVMAETGATTTTGGRLKAIERYIDTDTFMMTYGDGLSDVNVAALVKAHQEDGRLATLTAVHPAGRFGELDIRGSQVAGFAEKPEATKARINGGFMALDRRVLSYIDSDVFFEQTPMTRLAHEGQLGCYVHDGFWQCMDTPAERDKLNELWDDGAPWALWRNEETG
jgi:glucose-1-phosphate cytidylyltransferase